jgi:peptide/nickel transport system permease protein
MSTTSDVGVKQLVGVEPAIGDGGRRLPPTLAALQSSCSYGKTRVGLALTGVIVAVAVIGPFLAPHAPAQFVGAPFCGLSGKTPFGCDYLGRDVLSRTLWGGRNILWMSFAATTLGVVVGATLGLISGYSRNRLDEGIMRTLDVLLAFPGLVLTLVFVSVLGSNLWLIVTLVAISWAPGVARVCRGMTLETVNRDFVDAAEVIGVPRRRVLTREILPNIMTPLLVEYGLRLSWSIAYIAGISFLGFGIAAPAADWGLMLNENRVGLTLQPWAVALPALAIAAFTIGTNLITEGISRAVAGVDRKVPK